MADWNALRGYIKSNYKIAEDGLDSMKLVFFDGTRTQAVRITKTGDSGWAEISTAVCREDEISPREALSRNGKMIVGGLALQPSSGLVIFRHAFPPANLDPDEFEEPLLLAVNYGDRLERELSGGGDLW